MSEILSLDISGHLAEERARRKLPEVAPYGFDKHPIEVNEALERCAILRELASAME